jgi:hypothetical protein
MVDMQWRELTYQKMLLWTEWEDLTPTSTPQGHLRTEFREKPFFEPGWCWYPHEAGNSDYVALHWMRVKPHPSSGLERLTELPPERPND